MLFYIVVYRHSSNERARLIMRAQNEDNAKGLALEAFGNEWCVEKAVRVDDVHQMLEL